MESDNNSWESFCSHDTSCPNLSKLKTAWTVCLSPHLPPSNPWSNNSLKFLLFSTPQYSQLFPLVYWRQSLRQSVSQSVVALMKMWLNFPYHRIWLLVIPDKSNLLRMYAVEISYTGPNNHMIGSNTQNIINTVCLCFNIVLKIVYPVSGCVFFGTVFYHGPETH